MATAGTPNPQGGASPDQGAAPAASPQQGGAPQANQLQQALAQLAKVTETLASQNAIVQPELMQARSAFIQAMKKTMMASQPGQGAAPDSGAPPQGQ